MTDHLTPAESTLGPAADPVVGRRGLLRGGALLAGAAAGAAVALAAEPAQAADGDPVTIGAQNSAESTTALTIGDEDGSSLPTLTLQNANGPSLKLQPLPVGWAGELQVGEMVGTDLGPEVGVDGPQGLVKTPIATWLDLAELGTPFPTVPSRILDLRKPAGRTAIIRRSAPDAITSRGLLRAEQWIDVSVLPVGDDYALEAVFANLSVYQPQAPGFALVYTPGTRPPTSTFSFVARQAVSNAAFVGTGIVQGHYAVRLFTKADAWFQLDISGGVGSGLAPVPLRTTSRARSGRRDLVRKMRRTIERSAR